MSRRDQIKELAMIVGNGLEVYVAIHDSIFREANTFKSFLKNLVGRGVPMSKLLEDSECLIPLWDAIHQKMETFRRSTYSSLSDDEACYFDVLLRYVAAVRRTTAALIDRQQLLNQGSKGRPNNPMTWKAFQQKEKIYESAIQEYMTIGEELNALAPIIFERV
jgi:hypothetical protein